MEVTDALVLQRRTEREHDRVITVLSPTLGVREVLARGARRLLSKLAPSLEPFTWVQLHLVPGRRYPIVVGTDVRQTFLGLPKSIHRLAQASFVVEVVSQLARGEAGDARWFRLAVQELRRIDRASGVSFRPTDAFALTLFALRAVRLAGWQPNLTHCSVCQRSLNTGWSWFTQHPFGLTHRSCAPRPLGPRISHATRRYLTQRLSSLTNPRAVVPRTSVQEIGRLAVAAVDTLLDQPLRSRRFLRLWQAGTQR